MLLDLAENGRHFGEEFHAAVGQVSVDEVLKSGGVDDVEPLVVASRFFDFLLPMGFEGCLGDVWPDGFDLFNEFGELFVGGWVGGSLELIPGGRSGLSKEGVDSVDGVANEGGDSALGFAFFHQVQEVSDIFVVENGLDGLVLKGFDLLEFGDFPGRREPEFEAEGFGDAVEKAIEGADFKVVEVLQQFVQDRGGAGLVEFPIELAGEFGGR